MKSGTDKAADAIKRGVDDVRDTVNESKHRSAAEIEHDRRETAGDVMTPGEKLGSAAKEGKERVLADVDKTKRDARHP